MSKVRDLLQTEVWSKRTTKKILLVMMSMLLLVGIASAGSVWREYHQLSPQVRQEVIEALGEAERFRTASKDSFHEIAEAHKLSKDPLIQGVTLKDMRMEMAADKLISSAVTCRQWELGLIRQDLEPQKLQMSQDFFRESCIRYQKLDSDLHAAIASRWGF